MQDFHFKTLIERKIALIVCPFFVAKRLVELRSLFKQGLELEIDRGFLNSIISKSDCNFFASFLPRKLAHTFPFTCTQTHIHNNKLNWSCLFYSASFAGAHICSFLPISPGFHLIYKRKTQKHHRDLAKFPSHHARRSTHP